MKKKILSSVAALVLLGSTAGATITYTTKGGFVNGTGEGTKVNSNISYEDSLGNLDGQEVFSKIYWGVPSESGGSRSWLQSSADSPTGDIELDTPIEFAILTHHNYPITERGGSLEFVKLRREITLKDTDDPDPTHEFSRVFEFNLYNWETPNDAQNCPSSEDWPIYNFPRTLSNGEESHIFKGINDNTHPCYDAHDVAVVPGQDFTWEAGDNVYNIEIKGFFDENEQLTSTFWAPEDGSSSGHMHLTLTLKGPSHASIGNRIWIDEDYDGIQDTGENHTIRTDINITLYEEGNPDPIAWVNPDSSGNYLFNNVSTTTASGKQYQIKVVFPPEAAANFQFTKQNVGDDTTDSDVDANGATDWFELTGDTNDIDAGFVIGAIGDRVWIDEDKDGIQDENEEGLENVTVNLYKSENPDTVERSTTTGTDGRYIFEPVGSGNYVVEFVLPSDLYEFSPKGVGSDDTIDSDANQDTGRTDTITIDLNQPDQHFMKWDAGISLKPVAHPSVIIEKSTNGMDADDAPGPRIPVGSTLVWSYEISNNGDVELDNIVVKDSEEGTITCPDTKLAPNSTMKCSFTGIAVAGQYQNTGTVTATVTSETTTINASDLSHYFGYMPRVEKPSILIEKSTNGKDSDVTPGLSVTIGEPVKWVYHIYNNGNVEMNNIIVTDDKEGTVTCPKTILAAGDHMDCTLTGVAIKGQYENVGTVTAHDPEGGKYEASDASHYYGTEGGDNCPCNDVHSDGSDAMGTTGMIAMMLMTLFSALFFMRKEEEFNTTEK